MNTRDTMMRCAVCTAVVLALASGCGGGAGARGVGPAGPTGPRTTRLGPDGEGSSRPTYFVEGSAVAATEDEAYDAATQDLAAKLYGSAAWARALDVPVHDRAADPVNTQPASGMAAGQIRVTVGLDQARVAELLASVTEASWQPALPAPLAERLLPVAQAFFDRFVCERRALLLEQACEPAADAADPGAITAQVHAVAGAVRLRPFYDGGVPVATNSAPLRPVAVIAEHNLRGRWAPLADLPVVAVWQGQGALTPTQGVSDRDGVVRLVAADGAVFHGGAMMAQVVIDRDALLGPMAGLWPEGGDIAVLARRTSLDRFAVVTTERVQGKPAAERVLAPELQAALVTAGGTPGQVASVVASDLATTTASKLPLKLAALADTWRGSVDVVLVATVDSDYASQLGVHRVRYDARGQVRVYDVWTGAQIGQVEDAVTVSGVGEARADRAARAALAQKLADAVGALPR